jgi:hypothetical protein
MPTETIYVVIAIVVPFVIFAMALAYADYQTNVAKRP